MTHQEKLAFIRGKCVEVNPGVVNGSIGVCLNGTYVEKRKTTRTIRLADIILLLCNGKQEEIEFIEDYHLTELLQRWNLRKDDLNEQDEATISFIYDVLR